MEIRRVLLISLPAVLRETDHYLDDGHSFHLSLAYLAGMLRRQAYEVKILDCFAEKTKNLRPASQDNDGWVEYGLADDEILKYTSRFSPDIIGITIPFSCQHYVAHAIGGILKTNFPGIPIAAGGNHVTAVPEAFDRQIFDYLVVGEGEYVFLSLVDALNLGNDPAKIPGLYHGKESCQEFIKNLDDLPFPAIDLLPLEKLWCSGKRWINMIATRGCVYDCVFCSIHTIMGYKIRRRSVANVIAEISHWKKLYDIQEIYFEDDNLTLDIVWAKELFREIAKRNFSIRFYARNGIRADTIDRELLVLMKKAGFFDFMISPESGSQKTLDEIIGKKMRLEDCENAINLAMEVGLGVNTFFVIGFPEETQEDLEKTLNYALRLQKLGCAGFWISTATPYPGTRFYNQCIMEGYLDAEQVDFRRLRTVDYAVKKPQNDIDVVAFRQKMIEALAASHKSSPEKFIKRAIILVRDPRTFLFRLRYKMDTLRGSAKQKLSKPRI